MRSAVRAAPAALMSTFAKLLATLDRDRLHALCHRFGVPLLNKRDKDPAIEGLVNQVRPDQYVELFSKCNKEELMVMAKKLKADPKARSLQALAERVAAALANEATAGITASGTASSRKGSGRVFIVHGHDELMKTEVARMVEQWGLQAIILHEQPNKGRTVIEKLEHNSADADFAVVLLSPDDVGSLNRAIPLLDACIESLRILHPASPPPKVSPSKASREVFIVHGHDETIKLETARFVEGLGFKVVILSEQANRGRTVIENFEAHAGSAGFAIVLLTPDDFGGAASSAPESRPRARQNVILELGYFIGKLGRTHVCALYKGNLELPSDFDGFVYIKHEGHWKLELAKELKAVWPEVDMNKAL